MRYLLYWLQSRNKLFYGCIFFRQGAPSCWMQLRILFWLETQKSHEDWLQTVSSARLVGLLGLNLMLQMDVIYLHCILHTMSRYLFIILCEILKNTYLDLHPKTKKFTQLVFLCNYLIVIIVFYIMFKNLTRKKCQTIILWWFYINEVVHSKGPTHLAVLYFFQVCKRL